MGKRKIPMKLYVWDDVLEGWTSGMIVALARDLDHAVALAAEAGWPEGTSMARDMRGSDPHVTDVSAYADDAYFNYVFGGD